MRRTGNAMLAVIALLAIVIGLAMTSPGIAQEVLPGAVLVHLPQFEGEKSDVTCKTIEQVESGEETIRDFLGSGDDLKARESACGLICGDGTYAGDYCGDDDAFICVCQVDDGQSGINRPFGNTT